MALRYIYFILALAFSIEGIAADQCGGLATDQEIEKEIPRLTLQMIAKLRQGLDPMRGNAPNSSHRMAQFLSVYRVGILNLGLDIHANLRSPSPTSYRAAKSFYAKGILRFINAMGYFYPGIDIHPEWGWRYPDAMRTRSSVSERVKEYRELTETALPESQLSAYFLLKELAETKFQTRVAVVKDEYWWHRQHLLKMKPEDAANFCSGYIPYRLFSISHWSVSNRFNSLFSRHFCDFWLTNLVLPSLLQVVPKPNKQKCYFSHPLLCSQPEFATAWGICLDNLFWSKSNHHDLPAEWRQTIFTLLLIFHRHNARQETETSDEDAKRGLPSRLPPEMVLAALGYLPVSELVPRP